MQTQNILLIILLALQAFVVFKLIQIEKNLKGGENTASDDELFEEAKKIIMKEKQASASLLQRRLSIGYARAARLLDMLEQRGVIGHVKTGGERKIMDNL